MKAKTMQWKSGWFPTKKDISGICWKESHIASNIMTRDLMTAMGNPLWKSGCLLKNSKLITTIMAVPHRIGSCHDPERNTGQEDN